MKKFDPLILIVKGNDDLKAAYEFGVKFGREKEKEVQKIINDDLFDRYSKNISNRISLIDGGKVLPTRGTKNEIPIRQKKMV